MAKQVKYMDIPAFYDLFASFNPLFKEKMNFFLNVCSSHSHIVELGTGTGNIALHLASNGKHLTCVEPSIPVLNVLWSKVHEYNIYQSNITILPQTAQKFKLVKAAEIILAPNLFHLVTTDIDRNAILENTHGNLVKNGKLVISFFHKKKIRKESWQPSGEKTIGDILYRRYSQITPVLHNSFTLSRVSWRFEVVYHDKINKKFYEHFLCRHDSIDDVQRLLLTQGFKIENIFCDYLSTPVKKGSTADQLIVMATKS